MTTSVPSEVTFEQRVERANLVASRLLRSPFGAHTCEDVVSAFIEKQIRRGKSLQEIEAMLSSPKIHKYLTNSKNDIVRWEKAVKRGSDNPPVSFEEAEPILWGLLAKRGAGRSPESFDETDIPYGITTGDPESEVIRRERDAEMKSILTHLLEKVRLSDVQLEILKLDQKGFTNEEIARELGIDVAIVYTRRSEAHRKLAAAAKRLMRNAK